jgi:hypothetical protein
MYSGRDLPKEGLPHSDIRGSTIARISPRLIAACHVLHRLLVPRHPLNALLILTSLPCRPHAGPIRTAPGQTQPRELRLACPIGQPRNTETPNPTSLSACRAYTRYHQIQIHHEKQHGSPQQAKARQNGVFRNPSIPWRRSDSNRRPPACKAGALPLSYAPSRELNSRQTPALRTRPKRSLTHGPKPVWAREDLNLRPHAYQACALTN